MEEDTDDPTDTGDTGDTDAGPPANDTDEEEPGGCGCATGGDPAAILGPAWIGALLLRRRGRARA
jgi:MYXO-CTERM domain-containing protein